MIQYRADEDASHPLRPYAADVEFSILIGCYFEERSIDEFYTRLSATMKNLGRSYEIIFINDGSMDGTWDKLKAIYAKDENVSAIVDLMKNTGQANAKTPAVMLARGNAMALIDSDLQLDPEEFPELVKKYDEGYDIVTGFRQNRQDSFTRKLPSLIANMIMRRATQTRLKDFGCTYKIYRGQLVRAFDFGPFNPWQPVPVIAAAGRIAEVPISHHPRRYGKSGWTFRKLFAFNMENLVTLSERPFQWLAVGCVFLAMFFVLRVLLGYILPFSILPEVKGGLLLNALAVCTLLLLSVLAAIGEFTIRCFLKLQHRPAFVVREIFVKSWPSGVTNVSESNSDQ